MQPNAVITWRLPVDQRLALLFDGGTYDTVDLPKVPVDPLRFRDSRRYTERLREAQQKTSRGDALIVADGTIGGHRSIVAAMDFEFMGGSMGQAVGEGIVAAASLAVAQRAPLIAIPASGGARMQEGILSLMQMPRTVIAVQRVREAGLPYVVILTDPTTGGVSASFAMLGDIHIAEPGARIGFAGARVIEETIRQTLPPGFQRAEYLLDHGMVDIVVKRSELKSTLANLLDLLSVPYRQPMPELPAPEEEDVAPAAVAGDIVDVDVEAEDVVDVDVLDPDVDEAERAAADAGRPTGD